MQVQIEEAIRKNPNLAPAVEQATSYLEDRVKHSEEVITADWKVDWANSNHPQLDLTLSDSLGSVSHRFLPDQLKDSSSREDLLRRLYDDLLNVRTQKLRERIRGLLEKLEKE
jgi:hypothetical protein